MNFELLSEIINETSDYTPHQWNLGSGSPKFLIIAGLHGDEPTSIQVALNLINELKNYEINGSITIIPLANRLAFLSRSRKSLDNKDLNRSFPGDVNGTITEKIAHHIWKVAEGSDYVLDLHCCGLNSSPYLLALHNQYTISKEFATNFPLEICVQSTGESGQLFVEASKNNIPSLIIEIPGGGETGFVPIELVEKIQGVVMHALNNLDIIDFNEVKSNLAPVFGGKLTKIKSSKYGFFVPQVNPGSELDSNDIIGTINEVTPVRVKDNCRVIFSSSSKFIFEGEVIALVSEI